MNDLAEGRTDVVDRWADFLRQAPGIDESYQRATGPLELALNLDPRRTRARALMGDLLEARAELAELMGRTREREQLVDRLRLYDQAGHARRRAKVNISIQAQPGAAVTIERYVTRADGTLGTETASDSTQITPFPLSLAPGSYMLNLHADADHAEVRYPLVVHPDMHAPDVIRRPPLAAVPDGFVYVPPGRFLSGFGQDDGDEPLRKFYNAEPLHEREGGAFLIARHESTYEDWMQFLDACWPGGCYGLVPSLPAAEPSDTGIAVKLEPDPVHGWALELRPTRRLAYRAVRGQPLIYPRRTERNAQRWERFPVSGVSWNDVQIYLRWLRATGRLPGARLCTAREWERAARGADARLFPHGNHLDPGYANFDLTYGQKDYNFGPDEVGAHPESASPFGLQDMAGNVWEFVDDHTGLAGAGGTAQSSDTEATKVQVRGGSYFHQAEVNTVVNGAPVMSDQKHSTIGFRVCADAPPL
jgi:formylglycine-generating enzyme required for sulfatase activity